MDALTNELFERMVSHLHLQDIQQLRLVNRSIAYKATQSTFRPFFKAKQVDITRSALQDFSHMTSQGQLGCGIEKLTLVGIVYDLSILETIIETGEKYVDDPKRPQDKIPIECSEDELACFKDDLIALRRHKREYEALRGQESDIALLKDAFANLAVNGARGLQSLTLEIKVCRHNTTSRLLPMEAESGEIFERAAETFLLAMTCLRDSRLSANSLSIFSTKPESLVCSLPFSTLGRIDWSTAFESSLVSLRDFALSISQEQDETALQGQVEDKGNASNIAKMVGLCPQLETLTMTRFARPSSEEAGKLQVTMQYQYMHCLAQMEPLSHLNHLSLGGFHIAGSDIATFIKRHIGSLRSVELREIFIHDDVFRLLLTTLSQGTLERIHLEDIHLKYEGEWELVHFSGEREQEFTRISGDYLGRNVIERWGEGTKQLIECTPYLGRSVGSGKVSRWIKRRREEFGRSSIG